jgi:hypothetical protein
VALESLHLNRPVLGTPVGGLTELVVPSVTGWLADDTDGPALARALVRVLDGRDDVERMVRSGALVEHARTRCDERVIRDRYQELARCKPRRRRPTPPAPAPPPLVSAIVPYYRASEHVRDTISSLLSQTYGRLEIVLVNDGSFEHDDWVVAELAGRAPIVCVS